MLLEEAVAQLTRELNGTHLLSNVREAPDEAGEWHLVCSGGEIDDIREPQYPVLCLTEEDAIQFWIMTMLDLGAKKVWWCGEPRMLRLITTVADWPVQTQRFVETRYVVRAKLAYI